MSDNLMNPEFAEKVLTDCTEVYAQAQTIERETDIRIKRITAFLVEAELTSTDTNTVTLTREQANDIAGLLGHMQVHGRRMTSPWLTTISLIKDLTANRRYKIATAMNHRHK